MAVSANWIIPSRQKLAVEVAASYVRSPDGNANVKIMFLTTAPDETTAEFLTDVSGNEVGTGTAYPAGGLAVTYNSTASNGVEVIQDPGNLSNIRMNMDSFVLGEDNATGFNNGLAGVVYDDTEPVASNKRIYLIFVAANTFGNTAGVVNFNVNPSGILTR